MISVALVRRLGSDAVHALDIAQSPPGFIGVRFGATAFYFETPVVVACSAVLRAGAGVDGVVVMRPTTRVSCVACRRYVERLGLAAVVFNPRDLAGFGLDPHLEPVDDDLLPS